MNNRCFFFHQTVHILSTLRNDVRQILFVTASYITTPNIVVTERVFYLCDMIV
jgi:hypothetical protein